MNLSFYSLLCHQGVVVLSLSLSSSMNRATPSLIFVAWTQQPEPLLSPSHPYGLDRVDSFLFAEKLKTITSSLPSSSSPFLKILASLISSGCLSLLSPHSLSIIGMRNAFIISMFHEACLLWCVFHAFLNNNMLLFPLPKHSLPQFRPLVHSLQWMHILCLWKNITSRDNRPRHTKDVCAGHYGWKETLVLHLLKLVKACFVWPLP